MGKLRVELLASGVLEDYVTWVADQAAREGVDVGVIVERALDSERRKIEQRPRRDPRTKNPGARGMDARRNPPGTFDSAQLAALTGASMPTIHDLAEAGVIRSQVEPGRGRPRLYARKDALVVLAVETLAGYGVLAFERTGDLVSAAADSTLRDRFLVATGDHLFLVARHGIADQLNLYGAGVVVSLEALGRTIDDRLAAAGHVRAPQAGAYAATR